MSIQNEIDRIKGNIAQSYSAVQDLGGTIPAAANSANLPSAISTIPSVPNPLPISQGGTGGQTADAGMKNLISGMSAYSAESHAGSELFIPFIDTNTSRVQTVGRMPFNTLSTMVANRATPVQSADTAYTTYMARGISLVSSIPASMTNGTVALVYA